MLDEHRAQDERQSVEKIKAQAERDIPLAGYGQPKEFTADAVFLYLKPKHI